MIFGDHESYFNYFNPLIGLIYKKGEEGLSRMWTKADKGGDRVR